MRKRAFAAVLVLMSAPALAVAAPAAPSPAATPKAWARCAACHLADGRGVPGSFPRIAGRTAEAAMSEKGRAYLVLTISAGVMGPIEVDGKTIRGFMPAQAGLTDGDIASILNHATALPGADGKRPTGVKAFTADEVAVIKASAGRVNPNAVHASRAGVFGPPPPEIRKP